MDPALIPGSTFHSITTLIRRLAIMSVPHGARALSASKPPQETLDTSFNSPQQAFKSKYTSELVRAYFVYQICSFDWIVENNPMLIKKLRTVAGKSIFEFIMKSTFYGQFVGGEDTKAIIPIVKRLRAFGVNSILDYSVEEDLSQEEAEKREVSATVSSLGHDKAPDSLKQFHVDKKFADRRYKVSSVRTYFYLNETSCEKNMAAFIKSIDAVAEITKSTGLMAIKMTALGRPQLLLQISEVIMKARKYMMEMAGGTGNVLTHHKTTEDFQRYMGSNSKDPQVQDFMKRVTADKKGILHLFPWTDILNEELNLSTSFRVPDPATGQMRRLISQISAEEEKMFHNMLNRLNHLIEYANERNVCVMIDAEQTYFQPAISRICLEMMRKYNKKKSLVYNTYQTYLKATYGEVLADLEQAERQDFVWAAKFVRGAYLEQERARAASMKYDDPTCESVDATTASYHKCLKELLLRIKEKKAKYTVMVASHNEDTVRYALQLMKEYNLDKNNVLFGQLLGMCDHISFPLGQAGYSAYKYVPYGPVAEVIPYLSRRANENRGVLAKIKKEKRLLRTEIFRRIVARQMFYKPTM